MKLYFFLFVFVIALSETLLAQDTLVTYFDKDWNEISNKDVAVYYRKAFEDSNKTWIVNDYYKSKKIQMTGSFKSKKFKLRQGKFTYYYENGIQSSCGSFVNDLREGNWNYWHENGKLKSEGNYINNNREGEWISYHDNGAKKSEGIYNQDLAEGIWNFWNETGKKVAEGKYHNDHKEGIWKYWYANGELKYEETYVKGEITAMIGYYENGKINYKGNCVNGEKQGEWNYWNVDGKVYLKGAYHKGNQNGEWIRYFPGEEMKIIYMHGVPQGNAFGGIVLSK